MLTTPKKTQGVRLRIQSVEEEGSVVLISAKGEDNSKLHFAVTNEQQNCD
jgi:hypothetical protein